MRRTTILIAVALTALTVAAPALAARGGIPGSPATEPFIWADSEQYAAIVQTDLTFNGNEASYDLFYVFPNGEQTPISDSAPGDSDYNGGRWVPTPVTWNVDEYLIPSEADLLEAFEAGDVTIGVPDYEAAFLCPLIPGASR